MVAEALKAAEELEKQGISAAVIDMFTEKIIEKASSLALGGKL